MASRSAWCGVSGEVADQSDVPGHAREVRGVERHDDEFQAFERPDDRLLHAARGKNKVGAQRQDGLQIDALGRHSSDRRSATALGRIIVKRGPADYQTPGADGEKNFRVGRCERHDALGNPGH